MNTTTRILCLLPVVAAPWVLAAPFGISWWTVDSGGGTSQGGGYRVTGTIGQAESGTRSTGGGYAVTTGFWQQIEVLQVDGLPLLEIKRVGPGNVVLSWTESGTPLVVQESPNLAQGSWTTTPRPVFSVGNKRQIIIPGATGRAFFRLKVQ